MVISVDFDIPLGAQCFVGDFSLKNMKYETAEASVYQIGVCVTGLVLVMVVHKKTGCMFTYTPDRIFKTRKEALNYCKQKNAEK